MTPRGSPSPETSSPCRSRPGKFNYRLVRAELPFDDYGTVLARCRIDGGRDQVVPYTLLPPVG